MSTPASAAAERSPDNAVAVEPWGPGPLARARREGRLVALLVDAAWSPGRSAAGDVERARAAVPPDRGAAAYLLVDEAAEPAVALRGRWIARLFDVDERLPYAVVCVARPRSAALLPLYALPSQPTAAQLAARDRALAAWAADRGALALQALRHRRVLAASARRGWRGRPTLAAILADGIAATQADVEPTAGGWRSAPGRPRPTALRLLLVAAARGDAQAGELARRALARLAASGMCDPLDGGFFHAAHDASWRIPDFARTAADNAALLALYSAAAVQLDEPWFAEVARGIATYLLGTLRDPATRGFFASQAADERYYTWTTRQVTAALPFDRVQAACLHFDVQPRGGPLRDQSLNVLYPAMDATTLAPYIGCAPAEAAERIIAVREALRAARAERAAPPLDRTRYVDVNAQVVSALLAGAAALAEPAWRTAALATLAALEAECFSAAPVAVPHRLGGDAGTGEPYLGDYAALGRALLDAHATTGEPRYLQRARAVADALLARFRDPRAGALLDVPRTSLVSRAFWPEQPFEDGAGPAPAALAASLLLDLGQRPGGAAYREAALAALGTGAAAAGDDPVAAAGYYLTLAALAD
ncbi:MAG TPA: hypothetical protein VK066_04450 [Chloroflexota bacterium]|nr:hypothetical protein [Chloroflexota bacterium]